MSWSRLHTDPGQFWPGHAARGGGCARGVRLACVVAASLWFCGVGAAFAGHVRLKNGLVLSGKLSKLVSLTNAVDPNPGPTTVYQVIQIQTPYQRYFVPLRQVPDDGLNFDAALIRDVEFTIPWQLKTGRQFAIQSVDGVAEAVPWDSDGRRRVTLHTARGDVHVVQGITKVAPDHVLITGMTHTWDFGVGLDQIPQSVVESLLNNPLLCPPEDAGIRMARARFYIQAGWYPQADRELDQFSKDFPDLKDKADALRDGLVQLFGDHILRELQRRRDAGQFQLAEAYAHKLLQQPLGGGVQQNVQQFLFALKQSREALAKSATLLADYQGRLNDSEQSRAVAALRSQLLQELDLAGLPRLRPFLQAEDDPQLSPAEKLALAYTGWALGPENADTDLPAARSIWEARTCITEYLRAENSLVRNELFDQLRRLEGVGPQRVQKLLANLPPFRDAEMLVPGHAVRVELPAAGDRSATGYWVLLPPEYSPNRLYPCVLVLHAAGRTAEQAATFWGGTADEPGWAQRRGYIVIAPEYAAGGTREYSYGLGAHSAIMQCLRDARQRVAIDSDRVFLSGHDMGADAAFDIGLSHPDEFAGVIPIAGLPDLYARYYLDNGSQTAWYIVRGELGRDNEKNPFSVWADRTFKGAKFDLIYVQFPGRGQDAFADEVPRIFDWMDLHRRAEIPRDFEYKSLRQSDNQCHWVTAIDLPRTVLLQAAGIDRIGSGDLMRLAAKISPGNSIVVQSPARRHRVRLIDGIVDFDRRVTVSINGKSRFPSKFVSPDVLTLLEDYRIAGDRRRIAAAVLEF